MGGAGARQQGKCWALRSIRVPWWAPVRPHLRPAATTSPTASGSLVLAVSPVAQWGLLPHWGPWEGEGKGEGEGEGEGEREGKGRLHPLPPSDAAHPTCNPSGPPVRGTHVCSLANSSGPACGCLSPPWEMGWSGTGAGTGMKRTALLLLQPPLSPLPPAHEPSVPAR